MLEIVIVCNSYNNKIGLSSKLLKNKLNKKLKDNGKLTMMLNKKTSMMFSKILRVTITAKEPKMNKTL